MSSIPRSERETIIRRCDDQDCWEVYTESPVMQSRLAEISAQRGIMCERVGDHGFRCLIPKSWLKISPPRELSEAQRAVLARARERKQRNTPA